MAVDFGDFLDVGGFEERFGEGGGVHREDAVVREEDGVAFFERRYDAFRQCRGACPRVPRHGDAAFLQQRCAISTTFPAASMITMSAGASPFGFFR